MGSSLVPIIIGNCAFSDLRVCQIQVGADLGRGLSFRKLAANCMWPSPWRGTADQEAALAESISESSSEESGSSAAAAARPGPLESSWSVGCSPLGPAGEVAVALG